MVECSCSSCRLLLVLWNCQGWPCKWKGVGILPLSKVWSSLLWPSWARKEALGSIWMCCLWTQVVQVPTYDRESSGCIKMPIERLVQYLGWLITIQDIVRMPIIVLLLLEIKYNPLSHHWLWNHLFWHVFFRPRGILQMLKWGNWLGEHVGIMLSFMLYPNTDLSWSLKVQKSSLDWWCHLFLVGIPGWGPQH